MNKAILMGRLTKDPELRYTSASNLAVCKFTLAINRPFSKQGQERQADFIPVVTWNKLAEFCGKYFQKGGQVAVVGRIQTRTWDDNEGKRHYVTEVVADEAYFADSKRSDEMPLKYGENLTQDTSDGFYPADDNDGEDELPF